MMTNPSPSTSTTALTHAPQPWKIAKKAYWGKKANVKSKRYTKNEIKDIGRILPSRSGQNSRF